MLEEVEVYKIVVNLVQYWFFFGNYLLRQLVSAKARPDAKITAGGQTYFVRPDFCHATVERRWRLRQLVPSFQEKGWQAFVIAPARLKAVKGDEFHFFTSEVKAQEFLLSLKK